MTQRRVSTEQTGEEGYFLLGLVVACFLMLLLLAIAAPRVAKQLERDREVEAEHRAEEYVRAIQLYYKKTNTFPTSIDQLLGKGSSGMSLGGSSATVRYLRQKYKDPLTGDDFRLIHMGEAKTEVKGFFGEPLQGMAMGNLGSAAGMVSNLNSSPAGTFGAGSSSSVGGSSSGSTFGSSSTFGGSQTSSTGSSGSGSTTGSTGSSSSTSSTTGSTGSFGSGSIGSSSATGLQGSKGAIIGVGSNAKGHGLVEWNGSENIEDWEFLYDPRVELLKAKVSLFGGGGPATGSSNSLGSGFAPSSGLGSSSLPGMSTNSTGTSSSPATSSPTTPTNGTGSTN